MKKKKKIKKKNKTKTIQRIRQGLVAGGKNMKNEITTGEASELKSCEHTIETTQGAFVACGMALAKIQNSKLYRQDYGTFEEYCKGRWGWSKSRAYQIIEAAQVVNELPKSEQKTIETERQARRLLDEKKADLNQKRPPLVDKNKDIELDKTGWPIPDGILGEWNRATGVKNILFKLSEVRSAIKAAMDDDDIIFCEITNSTLADLNNAYTSLKCAIPFAVCSTCQGHQNKKCTLCRGRGFISQFRWDQCVPSEIKSIRSKAKK